MLVGMAGHGRRGGGVQAVVVEEGEVEGRLTHPIRRVDVDEASHLEQAEPHASKASAILVLLRLLIAHHLAVLVNEQRCLRAQLDVGELVLRERMVEVAWR
jgi:hypothetical protein